MAINNLMIVAVAAIIMAAVLAFGNTTVLPKVKAAVEAVVGGTAGTGGATTPPATN